MDSVLRAPSPAMRLWRAAVRLASSVGAGGGELLHPAKAKAMVRAVAAKMARELERFLLTYMDPLFSQRTLLENTLNHETSIRCDAFAQSFNAGARGSSTIE